MQICLDNQESFMRCKQKSIVVPKSWPMDPYIDEETPHEAQDPVDRDDLISFVRMFSPDGFAPS